MKKIILVLLLFGATIGNTYAQESQKIEKFSNHAFRMYAGLGSGVPIITGLVGLSYAYETGGALSRSFFGVSLDTQVGATYLWVAEATFNIQSSIGVGKRYQHGGRFFYDIIGVGYSFVTMKYVVGGAMSSMLVNFLSFHYTGKSGFYFSWRNNLTVPFTVYRRNDVPITFYNSGNDDNSLPFQAIEYRTYFTFGFDFSKLYNPKVYEKRSF